jgi:hypothetical protein
MANKNSTLTHLLFVLLVAVTALSVACGASDDDERNNSGEDAALVSQSGHFEAHLSPTPAAPVTGENTLHIHLMDPEGNGLTGASVAVEPWMPAHGHGSPEEPVVEEASDGVYTVSNLVYSMPGHWEVRIDITHDDTSDRLVAEYDVQ